MVHHYDKSQKFSAFSLADEAFHSGIAINDIGHHVTPPGHTYGPAVRDYWLVHVIAAGQGKFFKDGTVTQLSGGDCFIIRPMEVVTYSADEHAPWQYYWMGFSGEAAQALAQYAFPDNVSVVRQCNTALASLSAFYDALNSGVSMDELEVASRAYEVLSRLRRSISSCEPGQNDVVATAVRFLENNYFRSVSITDLSRELGVTRSHFNVVFSKRTGLSPYEFLTKLRIEKAKALLKSSDLRVSEIAYSVGYSGIERFSDMFRRHVGVSPLDYRKKDN